MSSACRVSFPRYVAVVFMASRDILAPSLYVPPE